jgi:hypothetical protein
MEIGTYTLAERTPDGRTGHLVSAERRLADLMEEMELANQPGLHVFGVTPGRNPLGNERVQAFPPSRLAFTPQPSL